MCNAIIICYEYILTNLVRKKNFSDKDMATKLAQYTYTMLHKIYLVPLFHHHYFRLHKELSEAFLKLKQNFDNRFLETYTFIHSRKTAPYLPSAFTHLFVTYLW